MTSLSRIAAGLIPLSESVWCLVCYDNTKDYYYYDDDDDVSRDKGVWLGNAAVRAHVFFSSGSRLSGTSWTIWPINARTSRVALLPVCARVWHYDRRWLVRLSSIFLFMQASIPKCVCILYVYESLLSLDKITFGPSPLCEVVMNKFESISNKTIEQCLRSRTNHLCPPFFLTIFLSLPSLQQYLLALYIHAT